MDVQRLSKQVFSSSVLNAVGRLISFTGIVFYANQIPQVTLGQYFLFVAVVSTIGYFGTLGSATKILREISRDNESSTELTTAIVITVVVATVLVLITVSLSPAINGFVGRDVTVFLILGIPAELYFQLTGSTLRGEKKIIRAQLLATGERGIRYVGGVLAVATGNDPFVSIAGTFLIGKIVHNVGATVMIETRMSKVGDITTFLSESIPMLVVRANSFGQQWLDTLVLGFIVPEELIAVYEVAWQLSSVTLLFINSIMAVGFPEISDMFHSQNHDQARKISEKMYFYGFLPAVGFVGGTIVVGGDVLTFLYGPKYSDAFLPLIILSVGRLFYVFAAVSNKILYALDGQTTSAKLASVGSIGNLVFNVLLVPLLLLPGAAIATAGSYLIQATLLYRLATEESGLSLRPSQFVKPVLVTPIMMGIVYSYQALLGDSVATLVSSILVGIVVFIGSLWGISGEFRSNVRQIFVAVVA